MKRLTSLFCLLFLMSVVVSGSYCIYIYVCREKGAVPSALLAGFTSLNPRTINYANSASEENCLCAYSFLKSRTKVCFVQNTADSCYNPNQDVVYLTEDSLSGDSAEAAHEFGHVLDRYLYDEDGDEAGYFSRQESFSLAYEADQIHMEELFRTQDLFETEAYRNLAVSDILFAFFYEDADTTGILTASYDAAGVPYWRHERAYMAVLEKRQTEVFADIFVIFLSDDAQAKDFVQTYLPNSSRMLLDEVKTRRW